MTTFKLRRPPGETDLEGFPARAHFPSPPLLHMTLRLPQSKIYCWARGAAREGGRLFLTEGLLGCAHRAQGQPPSEGGIPPDGWVSVGSLPPALATQTHPLGGIQCPPGGGLRIGSPATQTHPLGGIQSPPGGGVRCARSLHLLFTENLLILS